MSSFSQRLMRFDDYLLNQTVINPIHDLLRYYLPANLAGLMRYGNQGLHAGELDPDQALQRRLEIQGITPTNIEYPLFREVSAQNDLGIRNVIMLEVEGLSDSLLHHDFEGRPVMPFLRRLSQESLYFNKIYQSADATDGSVFSITTSLPKTFSEIKTEFFVAYEVNGRFGSLPTILGSETYRHYFLQAFRHRAGDFASFMGNQGYKTYDFADFETRLRAATRCQAAAGRLRRSVPVGVGKDIILLTGPLHRPAGNLHQSLTLGGPGRFSNSIWQAQARHLSLRRFEPAGFLRTAAQQPAGFRAYPGRTHRRSHQRYLRLRLL